MVFSVQTFDGSRGVFEHKAAGRVFEHLPSDLANA